MSAFEVDTACLYEVGRTLVEVSDLLASSSTALSREDAGSDRLDAALRDFTRRWGHGVREVGETSAALGQRLAEAARGYGSVESRLARAIEGSR
jgi:hypothetical protein